MSAAGLEIRSRAFVDGTDVGPDRSLQALDRYTDDRTTWIHTR